ncbi:hypothetical protein Vafri_16 [Volvox africanus]|nr:hypothetical protein Vafri_16 [Volvox africanus]
MIQTEALCRRLCPAQAVPLAEAHRADSSSLATPHVRAGRCALTLHLPCSFHAAPRTHPPGRAAGVHQPVVSLASVALASGQWVHVFPEGRINYDGKLGPLRWGCGKLVCEARQVSGGKDPVVLPFYHSNMGSVLPLSGTGFSMGHKVEVRASHSSWTISPAVAIRLIWRTSRRRGG